MIDAITAAIKHTFKQGDIVTIFRMHAIHGLLIEGKATVMDIIPHTSEFYVVCFRDEPSTFYERKIVLEGQEYPFHYQKTFNAKYGYNGLSR